MKCIARGGRPLDSVDPIDCREAMTSPELTMNNAPTKNNLIATEKAIQAAADAVSMARRVPAPLKSIGDQVIRSAGSVPANLEEGHGRLGRDRAHHWRIAYASAKEVAVHLRILCLSGAVPRGKAINTLNLFDEVRAMTWRLLHP